MTRKIRKNNWAVALDIFYIDNGNLYTDIEKIYPTYVSKHRPEHEKEIIILTVHRKDYVEIKIPAVLECLLKKICY